MISEDKEKSDILNIFFMSVVYSQISFLWGTHLPDLQIWVESRIHKLPTIQVETEAPGKPQVHGARRDLRKDLRELAKVTAVPFFIIYQCSRSTG